LPAHHEREADQDHHQRVARRATAPGRAAAAAGVAIVDRVARVARAVAVDVGLIRVRGTRAVVGRVRDAVAVEVRVARVALPVVDEAVEL